MDIQHRCNVILNVFCEQLMEAADMDPSYVLQEWTFLCYPQRAKVYTPRKSDTTLMKSSRWEGKAEKACCNGAKRPVRSNRTSSYTVPTRDLKISFNFSSRLSMRHGTLYFGSTFLGFSSFLFSLTLPNIS